MSTGMQWGWGSGALIPHRLDSHPKREHKQSLLQHPRSQTRLRHPTLRARRGKAPSLVFLTNGAALRWYLGDTITLGSCGSGVHFNSPRGKAGLGEIGRQEKHPSFRREQLILGWGMPAPPAPGSALSNAGHSLDSDCLNKWPPRGASLQEELRTF